MEWIKCSDRIPEENRAVLCFIPKDDEYDEDIMIGEWYSANDKIIWWCACRSSEPMRVTHWMELPFGPK